MSELKDVDDDVTGASCPVRLIIENAVSLMFLANSISIVVRRRGRKSIQGKRVNIPDFRSYVYFMEASFAELEVGDLQSRALTARPVPISFGLRLELIAST